ncbi:SWF or SNF family helicase [Streptomyces sp. NPDC051018]|uniref:SWF or SNF family helicase n=1 Tax=Streptomyces sp. NPDC051018 TaxID=3365639 RepID=UPI0037B962D9
MNDHFDEDDTLTEYGEPGEDGELSGDGDDGRGGFDGPEGADGPDGHHGFRGDDEKTFAALPPVHGRGFARSWWGQSWLKALEDTALDLAQLKKGRRHAREGSVGAVSVRPGRITAVVRDRDGTGQRCDVLLQELTDTEWDRFLDMAVDRAEHIAALLDREMPPHLVEDAATAGVELLPGIGDLEPECGCGAWDLCPHTAALCYTVARLLDEDPFVLLLMRGRGERRLLDELQARSVSRAAVGAPEEVPVPEGVPAEEVFAAAAVLPALPPPPPLPDAPGQPPSLDTEADPAPGIDPDALEFLASDAAVRAHRLLAEALAPDHGRQPVEAVLTPDQDAVRMAASVPGPVIAGRLAGGTGRQRTELELAVRAWNTGGPAALTVLDDTWAPGPEALARASAVLDGAWEEADRPRLRASGAGRWTVVGADAQLRLGGDGRWWPYRKEKGRWAPAGPADHDPAAALAGVVAGSE